LIPRLSALSQSLQCLLQPIVNGEAKRRRLLRLKIGLKKGSVKKYAKVMEEASKKLTTLSSRL